MAGRMAGRRELRGRSYAGARAILFLLMFARPPAAGAAAEDARAAIATDFLLHDANGKSLFDRPRWRRRRDAGPSVPEDDRLQMSFSVGAEQFSYTLCHAADSFAAEAFVTDGRGARRKIESRPTTYTTCVPAAGGKASPPSSDSAAATATVTFIDSHTITGVAQKEGQWPRYMRDSLYARLLCFRYATCAVVVHCSVSTRTWHSDPRRRDATPYLYHAGRLFDLLTVAASPDRAGASAGEGVGRPGSGHKAAPRLSVVKDTNPFSATTPCMASKPHIIYTHTHIYIYITSLPFLQWRPNQDLKCWGSQPKHVSNPAYRYNNQTRV